MKEETTFEYIIISIITTHLTTLWRKKKAFKGGSTFYSLSLTQLPAYSPHGDS